MEYPPTSSEPGTKRSNHWPALEIIKKMAKTKFNLFKVVLLEARRLALVPAVVGLEQESLDGRGQAGDLGDAKLC